MGLYADHVKRGVDIVASLSCLVVLSPLLLVIAIIVRLQDGGPAIFRQSRVGRYNRPFTLFKFRSMPTSTPNLPSSSARQLVITRFGRFLRRSNLDELPQLFNILRGEMSLIGPRPALPAQTELLRLRDAADVMRARPGLTGLAQVNSYDGMPEPEKVEWERRYVTNVSFLGDVGIVVRTFVYLFRPPPVY
jgi:O-antigen biosynthesis protein WbqP